MAKNEINMSLNNDVILKKISPYDNNQLSEMCGSDLLDFLTILNEFYLELRNNLELQKNITFGVEIECENAKMFEASEHLDKLSLKDEWLIDYDLSLDDGMEIISPILKDEQQSWHDLNNVCSVISNYGVIGKNSGGHIHIGTHVLGDKRCTWLNFIKLWSVYENIIFRFAYGEYLNARPSLNKYALPISSNLWYDYEKILADDLNLKKMLKRITYDKYSAFNLNNVKKNKCNKFLCSNTIEFRCPNGSLNSVIWQNNINFFTKLLLYCKSLKFNDDIVERRKRNNLNEYYSLEFYNEIFLEQALELSDLIFDNNLDKLYFLRQYLKSFEVCNKRSELVIAKKMIKN